MTSKARHQLELLPSQRAHVEKVTPDLIARVKRRSTLLDAWKYAQEISCLDDKTVYEELGIDGSHWTKIKNGRASPPADERFTRYMDVTQSEIPLIWLAESRGYDWSTIRKQSRQNTTPYRRPKNTRSGSGLPARRRRHEHRDALDQV